MSAKQIPVSVKDSYGNPVDDVKVTVKYFNGVSYDENTDSSGKAYFYAYPEIGTFATYFNVDDENYAANPVKINVKVTKAPLKLSAAKITSVSNKYVKLKATVHDEWGDKVLEGKVKFTINGKSYTVKVKNGVASKKIKLSKVKTYKYKASYTGKYYKSKSVYSKVIVKKPVKKYTIRKGSYSFKVTANQYKKIKYVKNHKYSRHLSTYANFKVKTNKYYYGEPVYAVVTTWSGIQNGHYYNYPQVQFVVMYGSNTWNWDYLTSHYKI